MIDAPEAFDPEAVRRYEHETGFDGLVALAAERHPGRITIKEKGST